MKKLGIALISIFVGSLIYILWRSDTLTMFIWFRQVRLETYVEFIRNSFGIFVVYIPNWIIYSLPNALWLFGGILVFDFIWGEKQSISKIFWITLFILVAIGSEIGQKFRIIPGTFDWKDIIWMIIAGSCAFFTIKYIKFKKGKSYD